MLSLSSSSSPFIRSSCFPFVLLPYACDGKDVKSRIEFLSIFVFRLLRSAHADMRKIHDTEEEHVKSNVNRCARTRFPPAAAYTTHNICKKRFLSVRIRLRKSIAWLGSLRRLHVTRAHTFETKFDYFHVINDNVMFNTVYSVSWMLCDCDLRDMNLWPMVSVAAERPIHGTPCALRTWKTRIAFLSPVKWFESGVFNQFEFEPNTYVTEAEDEAPNLIWESCLHYFIRQLDCGQILAIEHTITFLSSHSRPLTHFSFSPAPSMLDSTKSCG